MFQADTLKFRMVNMSISSRPAARQSRLCVSALRFVPKQAAILLRWRWKDFARRNHLAQDSIATAPGSKSEQKMSSA